MRINQNISAMNTYSRLTSANNAKSGSLAKLSSGLRINKAGDDAAGLAISEKMRGQVGGLKQSIRNAQDGISLVQTAEGALTETHSILNRMRDLAVQSANDTNTDSDRVEIQKEMNELSSEISRIADTTEFNTEKLLDGNFKDKKLHIGANSGQNTEININAMDGKALNVSKEGKSSVEADGVTFSSISGDVKSVTITEGTEGKSEVTNNDLTITIDKTKSGEENVAAIKKALSEQGVMLEGNLDASKFTDGGGGLAKVDLDQDKDFGVDVSNRKSADEAIKTIDAAVANVSGERSKLGSIQNRLEHTINNLTATSENLSSAESRIRDVDMAEEMMDFTKNNILSQAATSMLAQANQMPQSVLQLLG